MSRRKSDLSQLFSRQKWGEIAGRIEAEIPSRGQKRFALKAGISPTQLNSVLRGKSAGSLDLLTAIGSSHDLSIDWLLSGTGPKKESERRKLAEKEFPQKTEAVAREFEQIAQMIRERYGGTVDGSPMPSPSPAINIVSPEQAKDLEISGDFVSVRLLSDPAAAGSPREIKDEDIEGYCIIYRKWITHPEETTCIRIMGDSMAPILQDQSIVAVNHAARDLSEVANKIVAAHVKDEGIVVKWLRQTASKRWILESENRNYPILDLEDGSRIIGRVTWSWSLFR